MGPHRLLAKLCARNWTLGGLVLVSICLLAPCISSPDDARGAAKTPHGSADSNATIVRGTVTDADENPLRAHIVIRLTNSSEVIRTESDEKGKYEKEIPAAPKPHEILVEYFYANLPTRSIRFLAGRRSQEINAILYTDAQLRSLQGEFITREILQLREMLTAAQFRKEPDSNRYLRELTDREKLAARIDLLRDVARVKVSGDSARRQVEQDIRVLNEVGRSVFTFTPSDKGTGVAKVGATVRIRENVFEPQELTISLHDMVRWENVGVGSHTVTVDILKTGDPRETFNTGRVEPGQYVEIPFNKRGTFRYHCEYHQGMVGTITVK